MQRRWNAQAIEGETFFQPFPQTIRGRRRFLLQPIGQFAQPRHPVAGAHGGFHLRFLFLGQALAYVLDFVIAAALHGVLRAKHFVDRRPQRFRAVDHE